MLLLLTRVPGLLCRDKGSSEPVIPCPTVARGVRAVKSIPAAKPSPMLVICPGSAQLHPQGFRTWDTSATPSPHQGFSRQRWGNEGAGTQTGPCSRGNLLPAPLHSQEGLQELQTSCAVSHGSHCRATPREGPCCDPGPRLCSPGRWGEAVPAVAGTGPG